jgi:hypothetical protein
MTSDSEEPREDPLDLLDLGDELPGEAPEADVLEQHLAPTGSDSETEEPFEVPIEADPADVDEQHRPVGETEEDDYR